MGKTLGLKRASLPSASEVTSFRSKLLSLPEPSSKPEIVHTLVYCIGLSL